MYHTGLLPATQHLTLLPPGHFPETKLVSQETEESMQAPPPPVHGP